MLNKLLTFACAICCLQAKTQVKIITAVDTSLYIGIDNIVTIESKTIPPEEMELRTTACMRMGNSNSVKLLCLQPARGVLLEVVYKNKVVASKKINVNKIEDPVAYLLGDRLFTDSLVKRKQLSSLQSIITRTNCPLLKFPVTGFTAEVIHKGSGTGTITNESSLLSKEVKTLLFYAITGDKIIFNSIRVQAPDGSQKYVPAIELTVTE